MLTALIRATMWKNALLDWKAHYQYWKMPASTLLVANGCWLGWPWQIGGIGIQVSRSTWFVPVLLTGMCVYSNPFPNTDSLFMKFWYPWIYFCTLWEFLFRILRFWVTAVGDTLEIEELAAEEKRVGGRRSSGRGSQRKMGWVLGYCLIWNPSSRPGAEELWLSLRPGS